MVTTYKIELRGRQRILDSMTCSTNNRLSIIIRRLLNEVFYGEQEANVD